MFAAEPFAHIYLVSHKLQRINEKEIVSIEHTLHQSLPKAYKQFITIIGKGVFGGDIRILSPEQVFERQFMFNDKYTSRWTDDSITLKREEVHAGIILADTISGDHIRYIPTQPNSLYVFLRDRAYLEVQVIPYGFYNIGFWLDERGNTTRQMTLPYFTPHVDRRRRTFYAHNKTISLHEMRQLLERFLNRGIAYESVEEHEEEKHTTLFIPSIGGYIQWVELLYKDTEINELSCKLEYDTDYEAMAHVIMKQIIAIGFWHK